MPQSAKTLQVGDSYGAVVVDCLERAQIIDYEAAVGLNAPIHTDDNFAIRAGYPSVFAPGMLTMGVTARMLTDWGGDGRLVRFGGRFLNQVWPGDTLTATARIEEVRMDQGRWYAELVLSTLNQNTIEVFRGTACVLVDP